MKFETLLEISCFQLFNLTVLLKTKDCIHSKKKNYIAKNRNNLTNSNHIDLVTKLTQTTLVWFQF